MYKIYRKKYQSGVIFPWWECSPEDAFSEELFYDVDMSWSSNGDTQKAFHSNLGSLTILDRMTGFGWRDIETGYRDPQGKFWLASGHCNVLRSGSRTIQEAIDWVKRNANNCVGV
jgi:hypothetical protein